jgi:hypothetical protein
MDLKKESVVILKLSVSILKLSFTVLKLPISILKLFVTTLKLSITIPKTLSKKLYAGFSIFRGPHKSEITDMWAL